jgi:hypothetical protein
LIEAPLERGCATEDARDIPIRQLRSDTELCAVRLRRAVDAVLDSLDGGRIERISLRPFFTGGIETEEQLEAALDGIREECSRLIGEGKKIVVE